LAPDGTIRIHWRPNNLAAHIRLIRAAREMMRAAGYPVVLTQRMGIETNSHQCGTLRFGTDPATAVLDPFCRAHDVENLYVVDASFFPSSSATNPALTIAAQALRVADHMTRAMGMGESPLPADYYAMDNAYSSVDTTWACVNRRVRRLSKEISHAHDPSDARANARPVRRRRRRSHRRRAHCGPAW